MKEVQQTSGQNRRSGSRDHKTMKQMIQSGIKVNAIACSPIHVLLSGTWGDTADSRLLARRTILCVCCMNAVHVIIDIEHAIFIPILDIDGMIVVLHMNLYMYVS